LGFYRGGYHKYHEDIDKRKSDFGFYLAELLRSDIGDRKGYGLA
jgi:hypothetical protein